MGLILRLLNKMTKVKITDSSCRCLENTQNKLLNLPKKRKYHSPYEALNKIINNQEIHVYKALLSYCNSS